MFENNSFQFSLIVVKTKKSGAALYSINRTQMQNRSKQGGKDLPGLSSVFFDIIQMNPNVRSAFSQAVCPNFKPIQLRIEKSNRLLHKRPAVGCQQCRYRCCEPSS